MNEVKPKNPKMWHHGGLAVLDWYSDDMTFCSHKGCYVARCERHPSNIRCPETPHSYSDFYETDYCPIHREKSEMQDEMNDLQYTQPEDPDILRVVRCKDCRNVRKVDEFEWWCEGNGFPNALTTPVRYCSQGVRKDGFY